MLTCVALLLGFAQVAPSTVDSRTYVETFIDGLEALDKGEHDVAARMFELAGASAPSAPVWRVHAAVAHLRAGRADRARELAREALETGYPLDDLAAVAGAATEPHATLWLATPSADCSARPRTTARIDLARWQLLDFGRSMHRRAPSGSPAGSGARTT